MTKKRQPAAESGFRAGRPGKAFHDGKLYVFGKSREIVVLRGGDRPACWAKTGKRPSWFSSVSLAGSVFGQVLSYPAWPENQPVGLVGDCPVLASGQLCFPFYRRFRASDLAVARFRQTVPPVILDRLGRFRDRHWQLYNLMARCPGAADLVDSNPAVAFALANSRAFHPVSRPWDSARRLVRRRQRDILGWLGLPATEQARRIMAKIPAADLRMERLFRLKRLLRRDPEATLWLSHLPRLPADLLDALAFYRGAMSMPLLTEMLDENAGAIFWLSVANALRKELGLSWPVLRNEAALTTWYEGLAKRAAIEELVRELPNALPAAPLLPPPGCGIEPITTLRDLIVHGERQRNCCSRYAESILRGECFLYRVSRPVRATLSLVRRDDGAWGPGRVLGAVNTPIDDETAARLFDLVLGKPGATMEPPIATHTGTTPD
ncbi:MAG: hypothetical protein GX595_08515 [Lentisphaerae bacterium]|nr:hypothetical protein [Lentisphaerota bacterium]